jgi:hypothetical protein
VLILNHQEAHTQNVSRSDAELRIVLILFDYMNKSS